MSTTCRLCECRSEEGEDLALLKVYPGPRLEAYCLACYRMLHKRACVHLVDLPTTEDLPTEVMELRVPRYLVKDGSVLKMYYPKDFIDLGALRQKRKRERAR